MTDNRADEPTGTLSFGIMCDGRKLPAWQQRCVEDLIASGMTPALLIVDGGPDAPGRDAPTGAGRLSRERASHLLWGAYRRLCGRRISAMDRVGLDPAIQALPSITCRTRISGGWTQMFSERDVETISSYRLDFILRFAFGIIRGDILQASKYGVWSFHHGDEQRYRGGPPCFWELYNGSPVVGAMLQRLTERLDAGVVLHKGYFASDPRSYVRTYNRVLGQCTEWPARVCREILDGQVQRVLAEPVETSAPVYRRPTNRDMLDFARRQTWFRLVNRVRGSAQTPLWNVGIARAPIHQFLTGASGIPIDWLPEVPLGDFRADPMPLSGHGDEAAFLVEEWVGAEGRGRIALITWQPPAGQLHRDFTTIVPVGHSSYPYTLRRNGETLCFPESFQQREVSIWRQREERQSWDQIGVAIKDRALVDPTVFEHSGRWWLFATDEDNGGREKLYVWYADDPVGEWHPHLLNPVKTDVNSARPGGTPFVHDSRLYRPAQDCSGDYGAAVVINEVLTLTPTRFEERSVIRLPPTVPYPFGFHTLSALSDSTTLVDGRRYIRTPSSVRRSLSRRLRR